MKKLYILIHKSYLGPFLATFCISLFVLLMQFLFRYIEDLVGKGLGFDIILEFFGWVSLTIVPVAFPLAILLASIMTFGNLGENYELAALKASGISLYRIMRPLILLHILMFFGLIVYSNFVVPKATLNMYTLYYGIMRKNPELNIEEGVFSDLGESGYKLKIGKRDPKTKILHDVVIYNHSKSNINKEVTFAKSATMILNDVSGAIEFTLYDGATYEEMYKDKEERKKEKHQTAYFEQRTITINLNRDTFKETNKSFLSSNRKMMDIPSLDIMSDSLTRKLDRASNRYVNYLVQKDAFGVNQIKDKRVELDSANYKFEDIVNNIDKAKLNSVMSEASKAVRNIKKSIDVKVEGVQRQIDKIIDFDIEFHSRFTFAFACLIFFFIGAPLGAIIRKGGLGTPVVISIVFFMIYYASNLILKKMVDRGDMEAYIGMWISSAVLFPIGVFLTYKAVHDSVILDAGSYLEGIKKFFKKISRFFKSNK